MSTDYLEASGVDPAGLLAGMETHLSAMHSVGKTIFTRWADHIR